jgi:hypothetical protein
LLTSLSLLDARGAAAGSATWNLTPTGGGNWNTAANWTPNTVPNGPTDGASFGVSNTTGVSLSANTEVSGIVFNSGASAFTITTNPLLALTISGTGITNNSGITQNFASAVDGSGQTSFIQFTNSASAGSATVFTNVAGFGITGSSGATVFLNSSSAGGATFVNRSGEFGGAVFFRDSATASNGTFSNNGANTYVQFEDNSTASGGTFTNNGGDSSNPSSGATYFFGSASAGNGTFANNAGQVRNAFGGLTTFFENSTAAASTLIANGGSGGGNGGVITFTDTSLGGTARAEVFGNGTLDISAHITAGVSIGSLEGDGTVLLGSNNLTIGANLLKTVFSGLISGNGSITLNGATTLTLQNANTYLGGTTIILGGIIANNATGSATGPGPVQVNKDTLGGKGIIAGPVTIGTGTGPKAYLEPSVATKGATLTIQSLLTFKRDGNFTNRVNTSNATADRVVANGIVIQHGAQYHLNAVANKGLPIGTVFVVMSNTSASPINGSFTNFPEGSTMIAGRNTYQASYAGGDGNDMTLTVVP